MTFRSLFELHNTFGVRGPDFVVGMPVVFVNSLFALVMPKALFQEKLRPGIFVLLILIP